MAIISICFLKKATALEKINRRDLLKLFGFSPALGFNSNIVTHNPVSFEDPLSKAKRAQAQEKSLNHEYAEALREYSLSQKHLWQQLPYFSVIYPIFWCDTHTGLYNLYSLDNGSKAYRLGMHLVIDLENGGLLTPTYDSKYNYASDKFLLEFISPEDIDALAIIDFHKKWPSGYKQETINWYMAPEREFRLTPTSYSRRPGSIKIVHA